MKEKLKELLNKNIRKCLILSVLCVFLINGIVYADDTLAFTEMDDGGGKTYISNVSASVKDSVINDIIKGWKNFDTKIELGKYGLTSDQISELEYQAQSKAPDLFYVDSQAYAQSYNGKVSYLLPSYWISKSSYSKFKKAYDKEMKVALSGINDKMTDLEKVLYINDYLCQTCTYGDPDSIIAHRSYGALVYKTPVCQGYALAFCSLARKAGVKCYYVGSEDLNHAWNLVVINGKYYYIDATFNDPSYLNKTAEIIGQVRHYNFLISAKELKVREHNANDWQIQLVNVSLQKATDTKYDNYFWKYAYTAFQYYNGYWYGMDDNGNFSKYKCDGKDFKLVKKIDTVSKYMNATATWAGIIYYSDYYGVYAYNPATDKKSTIYTGENIRGIITQKSSGLCMKEADTVYSMKNLVVNTTYSLKKTKICFSVDGKTLAPSKELIYFYDGKAKKPEVVLSNGFRTLVKNVDYKITYKNNKKCGVAKVVIKGLSEYNGTVNKEFYISKTSGKCGKKAKWSYDAKSGTLKITGSGAMSNYNKTTSVPWHYLVNNIKKINIGSKITTIGKNAFANISLKTKVYVPKAKYNAYKNMFKRIGITKLYKK